MLTLCRENLLICFLIWDKIIMTSKLDDSTENLSQLDIFIRQANNMLCYLSKLKSCVAHILYHSLCTNLYGCDLRLISTAEIIDLYFAWRKGPRRVRNLLNISHTYLLHILSQCLSLFDEICRRSSNFIYTITK